MRSTPPQVEPVPGPSRLTSDDKFPEDIESNDGDSQEDEDEQNHDADDLGKGMNPEGFSGPSQKIVKPLTPEALAAFKAAQDKAGIIYISRIPPGMRPAKVRHLMSAYGDVGRVYLQQEDPKRAYLRKKYTSTKKPHFIEGWIEFKDKKIARSVAEMLNAQSIGGKKGSRWRDDVWTMKYLPKFRWNMLTEQVAHEAQLHQAKLRVELSQSRAEQQEYLRNVELAKVLEKRATKKKEKGEEFQLKERLPKRPRDDEDNPKWKKRKTAGGAESPGGQLGTVLGSVF